MKSFRNLKKAVLVLFASVLLSGSFAAPVWAHGHSGGNHHNNSGCYSNTSNNSQQGTYCAYHEKNHKQGAICKYYGPTKKKGAYCEYHDKYHKKKTNCKKYCTKHHTTHANGKKHHTLNIIKFQTAILA